MEEEQITNEESEETQTMQGSRVPQVKKQKDPKKVAAGKALARKNAEARNLKFKKDEEISSKVDVSTIYNGIQSIAGLVGTVFTLYYGWKFYESFRKTSQQNEVGESIPPPPRKTPDF